MTRIPIDPDGYSVNPNTGTIHTRYADHGNGVAAATGGGFQGPGQTKEADAADGDPL